MRWNGGSEWLDDLFKVIKLAPEFKLLTILIAVEMLNYSGQSIRCLPYLPS